MTSTHRRRNLQRHVVVGGHDLSHQRFGVNLNLRGGRVGRVEIHRLQKACRTVSRVVSVVVSVVVQQEKRSVKSDDMKFEDMALLLHNFTSQDTKHTTSNGAFNTGGTIYPASSPSRCPTSILPRLHIDWLTRRTKYESLHPQDD